MQQKTIMEAASVRNALEMQVSSMQKKNNTAAVSADSLRLVETDKFALRKKIQSIILQDAVQKRQ